MKTKLLLIFFTQKLSECYQVIRQQKTEIETRDNVITQLKEDAQQQAIEIENRDNEIALLKDAKCVLPTFFNFFFYNNNFIIKAAKKRKCIEGENTETKKPSASKSTEKNRHSECMQLLFLFYNIIIFIFTSIFISISPKTENVWYNLFILFLIIFIY